jgi:hypothetical protein
MLKDLYEIYIHIILNSCFKIWNEMLREQQEWRAPRETFPAEEWRSGVNPVTCSTSADLRSRVKSNCNGTLTPGLLLFFICEIFLFFYVFFLFLLSFRQFSNKSPKCQNQ